MFNRMHHRLFLTLLVLSLALPATASHRHAVRPPALQVITILQTTDIHHHANGSGHVGLDVDPVDATSVTGAYSRIAAYVNYVRTNSDHPVVLIDSGDWTMGTLYDLTLGARPLALAYLQAMHYDVVTLGNHEFDYTSRGLAGMLAASQSFGFNIPIVASNMNVNNDPNLGPFFGTGKPITPTYVETLPNGIKIGYIGLMGESAAFDAPTSVPTTFTPLSQDYAAIQAMVDDLRTNQGAQIVIALSHSGTNAAGTEGEDIDLARHVTGIDILASGHTHTPLADVHSIADGSWTTQLIDAGAFGTNVARLDIARNPASGKVKVLAFDNVDMNNATLASINSNLAPDPAMAAVVNQTDVQLNGSLAPLLAQTFPDYDPASLGKGVYHPVGVAAQAMISNDKNPVLSPNGLGDLAADGVRNTANAIIAQTLAGVGGNPANLPGYDFTPYQFGAVATGVIRSDLENGVPLTFADVYNVLPLGISPDQTQALPIGYPMISSYIDPADLKSVAAMQLVAQSNLVGSEFYLNLSGISYTLKSAETYTYFKYATGAGVLQVTAAKATAGSPAALQVLGAIAQMGSDHGAALLGLATNGNPYAGAMVKLNDANPDQSQVAANLATIADIASAALYGTTAVSKLVVSKAVAAIDKVYGFASTDGENTGATTELVAGTRIRAVADLYVMILLDAVQQQYGIQVRTYQTATGSTILSGSDMATLLGNRIDAAPGTAGVQELKEWMGLLSWIGTGLSGSIGPEYASTPMFTDFPSDGVAVRTRNASYPLADIGQMVGTIVALQAAP